MNLFQVIGEELKLIAQTFWVNYREGYKLGDCLRTARSAVKHLFAGLDEGGIGCCCGWVSDAGLAMEKQAQVRGHIEICPAAIAHREKTGCDLRGHKHEWKRDI